MPSHAQGNRFFINELDETVDAIFLDVVQAIEDYDWLEFWINSEGGDATRAFSLVALIERAKGCGLPVYTYVLSDAHSAGSIVAVAGTPGLRYIAVGGNHLMHYGNVELTATGPAELNRIARANQLHFERVVAHYVNNSKMNEDEVRELIQFDNMYVTASKCLTYGLSDKLLTSD